MFFNISTYMDGSMSVYVYLFAPIPEIIWCCCFFYSLLFSFEIIDNRNYNSWTNTNITQFIGHMCCILVNIRNNGRTNVWWQILSRKSHHYNIKQNIFLILACYIHRVFASNLCCAYAAYTKSAQYTHSAYYGWVHNTTLKSIQQLWVM